MSGPEWITNCYSCGRIIDKREKHEGGDGHGSNVALDKWVCSIECWGDVVDGPDFSTDPDAGAKRIAAWLGYDWNGLSEGSIVDRGFPVFTSAWKFQGRRDDLRRLAAELAIPSRAES